MDKKQLIKTIITVAPVFLVPLIVERKKIKDHPDVKKATDKTVSASKTVAGKSVQFKDAVVDKSSTAKDYVVEKKHDRDQKRELKRIAKEHDPAYIEKKGEKLAKENRKEASKKAKIMRKVTFPAELDAVEYCTEALRKRLIPVRDKVREIRKDEVAGCLRTTRGGSSKQALVRTYRLPLKARLIAV